MTKATTKAINAAIAPFGAEIVKGEGYFYLVGPAVEMAYSTSIPTPRLNCQTLDRWISDCMEVIRRAKENR